MAERLIPVWQTAASGCITDQPGLTSCGNRPVRRKLRWLAAYDLKRRTRCPTAYRPCCFVISATYLARMTPCAVALQSTRSFMKMQYSMTPKAVYFVAETRLMVSLV